MGDAARKDAAVEAAVRQLANGGAPPPQLNLKLEQANAVWAMQRCMSHLAQEAQALAQMGQKEVADVLISAGEHVTKHLTRYVADAQRVVVPSIVLP